MALDVENGRHSSIEWGTIMAGAILATAIGLVFFQFGAAVGVADLDDMRRNIPSPAKLLGGGIYVLIVQLIASTCGGYVAGRMRAPTLGTPLHEREVRDGIHGLMAWATGMVIIALSLFASTALVALTNNTVEPEVSREILRQRHTVSIILAFAAGASSLVSGVASWVAATKGGEHRDNQTDHSRQISFRKRT